MPSTTSSPAFSDIGIEHGLLWGIASELVPLFTHGNMGRAGALRMAISALQAYRPETHADYVNIARTIAFSISALALLGHAAGKDMPMPEKLRAFGRANALNRSADQSERTMMQRRFYHRAPVPAATKVSVPGPNPDDAAAQAMAAQAVAAARAQIQAFEAKTTPAEAKAPEPVPPPSPSAAKTVPLSAIQAALHPRGPLQRPLGPVRHDPADPHPGEPTTSPYKDGLLRQSAIQRVVDEAIARAG